LHGVELPELRFACSGLRQFPKGSRGKRVEKAAFCRVTGVGKEFSGFV
jgi:hypothetical protein